MRNTDD